jgi:Ran GTPase-activating protein (RanGAP) involved in mRNA processing and transport
MTEAAQNQLAQNITDIPGNASAMSGGDVAEMDDLQSIASYLTENVVPDSQLRIQMLRRDSKMLDISGIHINLEEAMDEFCAVLVDQNFPSDNNAFSFLYCDIGDKNLERVMYSLKMKDHVKMNLSWNKLGSKAMLALSPLVNSTEIATITSLELGGNYLGPVGCQVLFGNCRTDLTIEKIGLQGNAINNLGVLYICECITKQNLTLLALNVEDNGLSAAGALTLCQALSEESSKIQSLNLSNNAVGSEGSKHIGDMLGTNKSLTSLDIRHSSLGDAGIGFIAESMRANTSLRNLDVSDNDIGSQGGEALFSALVENTGLTSLRLTRSIGKLAYIGAAGAVAAGVMLKANQTLTSLE